MDLDRTLLRGASGEVLNRSLEAEGVFGRRLPGQGALYRLSERFGENLVAMTLARVAAVAARGWSQEAVRRAGTRAVPELRALVAPYAPEVMDRFRRQGLALVLATTSPYDMVAPVAEALGFDDVLATRYEVRDGRYTGRLEGGFVWGLGKLEAARAWARAHQVDLARCHACSDSLFDLPLLSSVGYPHAVQPDLGLQAVATARRWPVEHWDRPDGVPSVVGYEPFHLLRPFVRPELFPYARFQISGLEHIPRQGPAILAANHRSYFDVAALAVVVARVGRPVRFLGKRELFDAPVVGWVARALGGIPVDRGSGSVAPLAAGERALRAGELVVVLPQGTIPRGPAFFDPVLHGRTGTARLAAATGAPVIPIGIDGSERVWPRSSRLPDVTALGHPPTVTVRVGQPIALGGPDARADTEALMAAIAALLPPPDGRVPTPQELARTYPSGSEPETDGRREAPPEGPGESTAGDGAGPAVVPGVSPTAGPTR